MKLVINKEYGNFGHGVPAEFRELLHRPRTDAEFVAFVEDNEEHGSLTVIEFPDEITDWDIEEQDGLESIIYVLNGKLKWKYAE